jgi:hypothetical protein
MSFLFEGTVEQSYIAHAMAYSACIGPYDNNDCKNDRGYVEIQNNSRSNRSNFGFLLFFLLATVFV